MKQAEDSALRQSEVILFFVYLSQITTLIPLGSVRLLGIILGVNTVCT